MSNYLTGKPLPPLFTPTEGGPARPLPTQQEMRRRVEHEREALRAAEERRRQARKREDERRAAEQRAKREAREQAVAEAAARERAATKDRIRADLRRQGLTPGEVEAAASAALAALDAEAAKRVATEGDRAHAELVAFFRKRSRSMAFPEG